jgi:pectinesterase
MKILWSIVTFSLLKLVTAASRTSPPSGSYVVKSDASSGEYSTVSAAVAALPSDDTHQFIFIYPGVYNEQVYISRSGPTTVGFNCLSKAIKSESNAKMIEDLWLHH